MITTKIAPTIAPTIKETMVVPIKEINLANILLDCLTKVIPTKQIAA